MNEQLERIRKAYDLTVEWYNKGIDPLDNVPEELKNLPEFKAFQEETGISCSSGAPENREYLDPQPCMNFLDAGCGGGLAAYRLDRWPSTYYGVDISPRLIRAMQGFAENEKISTGGLWVADLADLPFDDDFFDIAAVIGVFEYHTLDYIAEALKELHRVLKPRARIVMDIPNLEHPHVKVMFKLEEYLGRPNIPKSRSAFEEILTPQFSIERTDDTQVMLKYFVRRTHN